MRTQRFRRARFLLLAGVAVASLGTALLAPIGAAGATGVTLYVRTGASGGSCAGTTTLEACGSVGAAVNVAKHDAGAVLITVGSGVFLTVDVDPSTGTENSLTIQGVGETLTRLTGTTGTTAASVFTLRNGTVPVTIEDVAIVDGAATTCVAGGGGVSGGLNKSFSLVDDLFTDDRAACIGGAVSIGSGSRVSITGDTFTTDSSGTAGGAIFMTDSVVSITGSTFTHLHSFGSVAFVAAESVLTVRDSRFSTLVATEQNDLAFVEFSTGTIDTSAVDGSCLVSNSTLQGTNDQMTGTAPSTCGLFLRGRATTCIPDTIACASSAATPGRSVTVTSRGVSVSYSGHGEVSVGNYHSDPAHKLGNGGGTFFGVAISTATGVRSLVVQIPATDAGKALEWWNGSSWQIVDAIASCGTTTCSEFIFSSTSSPSIATIAKLSRISRFDGAVFAVE